MNYPVQNTAFVLIDPFNDFLSEGGKLYPYTKETVQGIGLINNVKRLLDVVREKGIQVIYAPHHHTQKGDYMNWRFRAPSHEGSMKTTLFEKGSWGAEFHPELAMKQGDLLAQSHWTASGFANTDLDFLLRMHSKSHIILAGMRANTCIDSTARYGVELGYHVTLVKDGIAAFNFDEVEVVVRHTFPNYGHVLASTDELISTLSQVKQ